MKAKTKRNMDYMGKVLPIQQQQIKEDEEREKEDKGKK
jgi:hypothetical protein